MSEGQLGFDWGNGQSPGSAPPQLPLAARLKDRLGGLAQRGIYLGTSSWKYPGWIGQVYDPARYKVRNASAQRRFERDCLAEYAGVFPTVCGDFAFYQFPSAAAWEQTFSQIPEGFLFSLKVCEAVTVQRFPDLPRYGSRAGKPNPDFMSASLVQDRLLAPLEPYRERIGVLILEFGTIHEGPARQVGPFAAALDDMLSRLPTDHFRFAVEVRNPSFLAPAGEYLECLRAHRVAHCFNSWTRMPPVHEQVQTPGAFTADYTVARFLLRPGRRYQESVDAFSPYEHVRDPYPECRQAISGLIERCLADQRILFAYVNNRLEGNAPETIDLATEP
jgi:uncharacterized protein YecE (DUF72 family)